MTTPDPIIVELAERVRAARQARSTATLCPTGGPHTWQYARLSPGEGLYTCLKCGLRLSKQDLKKATDQPTMVIEI